MVVFAVFFTLGVWLLQQQAALPDFAWAWLLLGFLLLLPVRLPSSVLHSDKLIARSVHILLLAAMACGAGFYHAAWQAEQRLAVGLPDEWQGRDIEVIGVIAELPRRYEHGLRFRFDVEQTVTPQAAVPQHVYLSTYFDSKTKPLELRAGERWQLMLRLKQPHGSSNPHGFDFEVWALENNIRAVGHVNNKANNVRLAAHADGIGYRIETSRESIRDKLNTTLASAPYSGVLVALTIGDQSGIPQSQWQVFTRTGVNHLMSISGLHITMLASAGFALTYWLWRRSTRLTLRLPARKAAALVAFLVALGYALLSGFAVPAQRTVYMVGAVAAALWLSRNFSLGQILSIAVLGVLVPDPWAVISPGFWLSFGAVALILYVSAYRLRQPHWLMAYAKVQWAMTVGLIPLLLALFQQVSLVSPIANTFAIPLVSLIVVPLALLGTALPLDAPLWMAHGAMTWAMLILEWLNSLPQAVWEQHAPPAWSIVAGMLGVLLILLPRGFPARWVGSILMLPMFFNTPAQPAQDSVRVIIFDVGQGLAVAAKTTHHALLYDTGPDFYGDTDSGSRVLVPVLRALGIAALDGLVLTHDDTDHTGGALSVMQSMPIAWLSSSLPEQSPILQQAVNNQRRCADGQNWDWDGVHFEMLHPSIESHQQEKIRKNNRGCVLRISTGNEHILLASDIEKESEQRLLKEHADKLPATLLVVPHHGSMTSSVQTFVEAVHPRYAVFTAGYLNRFGHPKKEVVERYRGAESDLLRSDEDGAILVDMNANGMRVERYRKTNARYWTHLPQH